jgi:hypothetical protein
MTLVGMSSLEHAITAGDAPLSTVAPNVWMRHARRTRVFAGLAYVNAVGWVAIGADVSTKARYTSHTANFLVTLVFLLGVAALSVIAGRRLGRCGLWMSAEEVVVNGPLRTWTLSVGEVDRFEPGVLGARNGIPSPTLRRTDGRLIGVWALGREGLISSYRGYLEELRPLCDELNELTRTLRPAPGAAGK